MGTLFFAYFVASITLYGGIERLSWEEKKRLIGGFGGKLLIINYFVVVGVLVWMLL